MVSIGTIWQAKDLAAKGGTRAIAIVRSLRSGYDGVEQWQELSPSVGLLAEFNGWRKDARWAQAQYRQMKFQSEYVPRFLQELRNNPAAHDKLVEIWNMDHDGKRVFLACFCSDEELCHRSIVAGLLSGIGVRVVTRTGRDYLEYYKAFRRLPPPAFTK